MDESMELYLKKSRNSTFSIHWYIEMCPINSRIFFILQFWLIEHFVDSFDDSIKNYFEQNS